MKKISRKKFSAEFKEKVAIEALKKTIAELEATKINLSSYPCY